MSNLKCATLKYQHPKRATLFMSILCTILSSKPINWCYALFTLICDGSVLHSKLIWHYFSFLSFFNFAKAKDIRANTHGTAHMFSKKAIANCEMDLSHETHTHTHKKALSKYKHLMWMKLNTSRSSRRVSKQMKKKNEQEKEWKRTKSGRKTETKT